MWKRIDIQYKAFCGIIIDWEITITAPKHHSGNKPETKHIWISREYHKNMINRLIKRGWEYTHDGLRHTLILVEQEN